MKDEPDPALLQLDLRGQLEMLVQQGAAALKLWSQSDTVPVEAMRNAAEAALRA